MDFLDYVKMCQEETVSERENTMTEMDNRFNCQGMLYKVEQGDTLYSISRKYDLKVRDLMRVNPFVNVYNLQVGEELCLPIAPGNLPNGEKTYVVKPGDTILSILKQNRVTFEELARLNRSVSVLTLPPDTILLIP